VHHSALWVRDVDASLRFYVDGLGLEVVMDERFTGEWPVLFDVPSTSLRSVFLGDRRHPDSGIVELVTFDGVAAPGPTPHAGTGFLLLSFFVDVDEVVGRLEALGFGPVRRIEQPAPAGPVAMATLVDPDGVLVELIDLGRNSPGGNASPGGRTHRGR
jgi:catechol 2,3-dioxygenase-like lactoylglutathione lyase family enzyme